MAAEDAHDEVIADLLNQIQVYCFPRRIRVKEFFRDYDPLRAGRCTLPQFLRAMNTFGMNMTIEQASALADHFTEVGPERPQVVNYNAFATAVDEVFKDDENPNPYMMSSSPSSTQLMTFIPNSVEDEDAVMHLLHRVAMLCKTRGITLKYCYFDCDRAAIASPSRVNPRRGGKVTEAQFTRQWPFKKEFTEGDMSLLIQRYKTPAGDIHFQLLHNDVTESMSHEMPPFPKSDLILRADDTEWSHHSLDPVRKVQAKVVEKRVRMYEHFQDFDPLRKGYCTIGQVKTVFTILNLGKEIDRGDFECLAANYTRDDGLFCYAAFCRDVDGAFATPNLERDPLMQSTMPDATTTAPARRNKISLTQDRRELVEELLDKIRTRVRTRRILMKPSFQDMDRTLRGYITRNQFTRQMHMLGFELDEVNIGLLASVFCDFGNHNDVNYIDFCKAIDPPSEDLEVAMQQAMAPPTDKQPSKYFDTRGNIVGRATITC